MTTDSDAAAIDERLADQRGRHGLDVAQCPVGDFGYPVEQPALRPLVGHALRAAVAATERYDHRPSARHEPLRDGLGIVRRVDTAP